MKYIYRERENEVKAVLTEKTLLEVILRRKEM